MMTTGNATGPGNDCSTQASTRIERSFWVRVAFTLTLVAALSEAVSAKGLCVNPGGTGGCYPTINAAVAAAASGETI